MPVTGVGEVLIEPESKICPCGSLLVRTSLHRHSEALDIVPTVVGVKRTIRLHYECRACASVIFPGFGAHVRNGMSAW
ncbi:IS66 family transposase zinc-finger binding domain-containing protein [Ensifer adhaerens]|uniref:IS66 family transposase zinc-finger binding domain-containing protein n=1 Tax=Ensifer adhaerens TaxID=106592 RepID=UPI003B84935E